MAFMESFPVCLPIQVRFSDLDTLGHVNNAAYLSYLELARIAYFQRILPGWLQGGHFVLARVEVDYKTPLFLEDRVEVLARALKLGRSSFTMEYRVLKNGEEAARALSVQVYLEGGRPTPIPEALRRAMGALEGGALTPLHPGMGNG
jgi:acyl-CoA thioester hydrolase